MKQSKYNFCIHVLSLKHISVILSQFNRSISRTHHCIMNTTQNCNLPGASNLLRQLNAIILLTNSWCNVDPVYHNECLNGLHFNIDNLVSFDVRYVNYILKLNLRMDLFRFVLSRSFDNDTIKTGMSILGLDTSLLPVLRNDSYIIVPSVLGYLFKNKDIKGVDLQSLAHFVADVSTVKNNAGQFGDGLNLPGGGYGGINLPGGGFGSGINGTGTGSSSGGDFGYGLGLPGGYGSSGGLSGVSIDRNIDEIATLLFRSNTNGMKLTQRFLKVMNRSVAEITPMIDGNNGQVYKQQKHQLCHTIQDLLHCAYGNIYNSFVTASKRQEFIAKTSLSLLEDVAVGMCKGTFTITHYKLEVLFSYF